MNEWDDPLDRPIKQVRIVLNISKIGFQIPKLANAEATKLIVVYRGKSRVDILTSLLICNICLECCLFIVEGANLKRTQSHLIQCPLIFEDLNFRERFSPSLMMANQSWPHSHPRISFQLV